MGRDCIPKSKVFHSKYATPLTCSLPDTKNAWDWIGLYTAWGGIR